MRNFTAQTTITTLIAIAFTICTTAAQATITFCNKVEHVVNVAIAYPQSNGSFISRGWLSLSPGECAPFDTALHVATFYFRAETPFYRNQAGHVTRDFWGKGRKFAMWENDNYQYYNAEHQVLRSALQEFTQGPENSNGDVSTTVTFTPGGSVMTIDSH